MTLIQWMRDKFGLNPNMTQEQLNSEFLSKSAKLAKRGKVEVYQGTQQVMRDVWLEHRDHCFIIIFRNSKLRRPKAFSEWFKEVKF